MSYIGTDREPRFSAASLENPSVSLADPNAYEQIFGNEHRTAGVTVSPQTAMTMAAVYACVRVRAETVAALPLHVYRNEEAGKKIAKDHPVYYLLHDRPNPYLSSAAWRKLVSAHVDLWGNHYSLINMNRSGQVLGLYPMMPWQVTPKRTPGQGIVYEVQTDAGRGLIPYEEMLHIPGLGWDGLQGYSAISLMRNAVGIGMAAERFTSDFYENDARPGVVVETQAGTSPKQADAIKDQMDQKFKAPGKKWKTMVLGPGLKLHPVQMPLADAQFIETRKFQMNEIARIYRVPPHMIGDLDKATFSNIEQQDIGFAKHTIVPACVDIEQELNFKLFSDRSAAFAEFNLDGLMRGDFLTRMQGYRELVNAGIASRSEVRARENFDRRPELDRFLVQGAMVTVNDDGTLDKPEPKPAQPDPATPPA